MTLSTVGLSDSAAKFTGGALGTGGKAQNSYNAYILLTTVFTIFQCLYKHRGGGRSSTYSICSNSNVIIIERMQISQSYCCIG